MEHTYSVTGMTCNGCKASVTQKLNELANIKSVSVDLQKAEARLTMSEHVPITTLQAALPNKFTITNKENTRSQNHSSTSLQTESKLKQLRPLLLIFLYLTAAALLLNYENGSIRDAMLDFMGLFYIVFSFFKMLDLKGFPQSFSMYDPLAKKLPVYGWIYPFIETALGLMFLMRFKISWALVITLFILGITTVGVTQTLLSKKKIKCACLGTALNLPMTEATFIENTIMIAMATAMLIM